MGIGEVKPLPFSNRVGIYPAAGTLSDRDITTPKEIFELELAPVGIGEGWN